MWFCRADFDIANKVALMSDYLTSSTSHSKSTSINPTVASCSPQSPTPGSNTVSSSVGDSGPGGIVRENSKTAVHEALLGTAHRSANRSRLSVNLIAPVNQVFVACGFCGWRLGPQAQSQSNLCRQWHRCILGHNGLHGDGIHHFIFAQFADARWRW
ncbi:hypothetical protein AHF37_09107 [Paragonimus kellicotti]|nr:hypothetical protein AHF37_09107 [Paragonimus kellicotti]